MRVVFTIFYSLDDNCYYIYEDGYGKRTDFYSGDYNYVMNMIFVYLIVYVSYYDFEKIYVGGYLYIIKFQIKMDYRRYIEKR